MNFYYRIAAGILLGLIVGAVNFTLLRLFVRLALRNAGRFGSVLIIIASYAVRYLLIAAVVIWLMRRNEQMMALIVLMVLGALTILLAAWQQRKKAQAQEENNGRN